MDGSAGDGTPAISDGVVYVGDQAGYVYAIDAETGEERWQTEVGGDEVSAPAVIDGVVYAGVSEEASDADEPAGVVVALDAQSGEEQWRFDALGEYAFAPEYISAPVAAAGIVYIATHTHEEDEDFFPGWLYAIDADTGESSWSVAGGPSGYWVNSPPALAHERIYAGDQHGGVSAVGAMSGDGGWTQQVTNWLTSGAAVAEDTVYLVARSGTSDDIASHSIYALDAESGDVRWSFPVDLVDLDVESSTSRTWPTPPAVAGGTVVVSGRDDDDYAELIALDAEKGELRWRFSPEDDGRFSAPSVADGVVYVGSDEGTLYAINAADGTELWSYDVSDSQLYAPAIVDGVVYVLSESGYVYALEGSEEEANETEDEVSARQMDQPARDLRRCPSAARPWAAAPSPCRASVVMSKPLRPASLSPAKLRSSSMTRCSSVVEDNGNPQPRLFCDPVPAASTRPRGPPRPLSTTWSTRAW